MNRTRSLPWLGLVLATRRAAGVGPPAGLVGRPAAPPRWAAVPGPAPAIDGRSGGALVRLILSSVLYICYVFQVGFRNFPSGYASLAPGRGARATLMQRARRRPGARPRHDGHQRISMCRPRRRQRPMGPATPAAT